MKTKLKNGPREAREGMREPDGQMVKKEPFPQLKKSRNGIEMGLAAVPCTKSAMKECDYHLTDLWLSL